MRCLIRSPTILPFHFCQVFGPSWDILNLLYTLSWHSAVFLHQMHEQCPHLGGRCVSIICILIAASIEGLCHSNVWSLLNTGITVSSTTLSTLHFESTMWKLCIGSFEKYRQCMSYRRKVWCLKITKAKYLLWRITQWYGIDEKAFACQQCVFVCHQAIYHHLLCDCGTIAMHCTRNIQDGSH